MSGWYWAFWAVLTVVNAAIFLGTLRNLRSTVDLLARVMREVKR